MPDRAELDRIWRALAAEPDRQQALELLLGEARRLTRAEAGTVYLREGEHLRFAASQNDVLARRLGPDEVRRRLTVAPLELTAPSSARPSSPFIWMSSRIRSGRPPRSTFAGSAPFGAGAPL